MRLSLFYSQVNVLCIPIIQHPCVSNGKKEGYITIAHPECRHEVIERADQSGSTAFIWDYVTQNKGHTKCYAIATENHMVENLKQACKPLGITVVNLAEVPQSIHPAHKHAAVRQCHVTIRTSCGFTGFTKTSKPMGTTRSKPVIKSMSLLVYATAWVSKIKHGS